MFEPHNVNSYDSSFHNRWITEYHLSLPFNHLQFPFTLSFKVIYRLSHLMHHHFPIEFPNLICSIQVLHTVILSEVLLNLRSSLLVKRSTMYSFHLFFFLHFYPFFQTSIISLLIFLHSCKSSTFYRNRTKIGIEYSNYWDKQTSNECKSSTYKMANMFIFLTWLIRLHPHQIQPRPNNIY